MLWIPFMQFDFIYAISEFRKDSEKINVSLIISDELVDQN